MTDGKDSIVRSEDVQSACEHEPEPSLGGAEDFLLNPIGDPDHEGVGEQRITEALYGIGEEQDRIVHLGYSDSCESGDADQVHDQTCQHRFLHTEGLCYDSREP